MFLQSVCLNVVDALPHQLLNRLCVLEVFDVDNILFELPLGIAPEHLYWIQLARVPTVKDYFLIVSPRPVSDFK